VTNFYVRLYDDSDGTTANKADALWARLVTGVHVKDGNFTFEIKDSCGAVLPARCAKLQDAFASLTGDRLTVGVTPFLDDYDEIRPRQQLVTVPYAASAGDARGLRGDVRLGGGLTVCNASVVSAAFERGVSHQGPVTFTMTPSLPSLTLGNDRLFVAESVETTNEFQTTTLETDFVVAREATVTVKYVGSIVATNLTVRGDVHAAALVAPAVTNALTIHGDVKTSEIEAARIVMDGSVRLFEFLPDTVTIDYDNGDPGSLWEWSKNGVTGSWTLPSGSDYTHNHLVSLSLKLPKDGSAEITVNGQAVATLKVKGVSGDTWVPFQTLLRPGETLSWVCSWSFGTGDVRLVARAAKF